MSRRFSQPVLQCLTACAALALIGCEAEPVVTQYTAPRDAESRPFSCTVPLNWKLAANDQFSDLAFESDTGARVTISSLPKAGDDFALANINRWRNQVSLEPMDNLDAVEVIKIDGFDARVVEMLGAAKGLKGALIERAGKTWVLKMSGTSAVVKDQGDEFLKFVESVEFFENRS